MSFLYPHVIIVQTPTKLRIISLEKVWKNEFFQTKSRKDFRPQKALSNIPDSARPPLGTGILRFLVLACLLACLIQIHFPLLAREKRTLSSRVNISLKASRASQISQNQIGLLLTLKLYDSCCLCASLSSRTQLTVLSIPDMSQQHLGMPLWSQSAVKCKKCRLQSMLIYILPKKPTYLSKYWSGIIVS